MQTYAQSSMLIVKEITKLMLLTTSILILINIRLKLTVQLKLPVKGEWEEYDHI